MGWDRLIKIFYAMPQSLSLFLWLLGLERKEEKGKKKLKKWYLQHFFKC
jgi:hypothetical protein